MITYIRNEKETDVAPFEKMTVEFKDASDEAGTYLNRGEVSFTLDPNGTDYSTNKKAIIKSTIGKCLWTRMDDFRETCAAEIFRIVKHVRTSNLRIVFRHITLSGQLITAAKIIGPNDLDSYMSMDKVPLMNLCRMLVDQIMLAAIDQMSAAIEPTYISHSDLVVPFSESGFKDLIVADSCGPTISSSVDELKKELDAVKDKMYEMTAVPKSLMDQDYVTAKDILDGKFDKYLGRDKKTDKSEEVRGDGTALSPLRSNIYDIKTEFDSMRNKIRASAERSECDGDSMFQSSKTSWI